MISFYKDGERHLLDVEPHDVLSDRDVEQMYKEMLDDCYGQVKVAGYEYDTSDLLESVDPTAFRCGLADYTDSENLSEIEHDGRMIGYITEDTAEELIAESESEIEE